MAEQGTLAVNADVVEEAGKNANSTYTAEAYTNKYIKKAEGALCRISRYDWVTNYASVSTIGKEALRDAVSSYAAFKAVKQDMSGYTSRQEGMILLNALWASWMDCVNDFKKDNKYKDFVLTGSGDID
jgi:hypothetical protein